MADAHPTLRSLERHLAAVYRLMHSYLMAFIDRQAAEIGDPEFLAWLKDLHDVLQPSEDRYGRFHARFLESAVRLQAMRLFAGQEGCARFRDDDYQEILRGFSEPLSPDDLASLRDLRDECLSHVGLTVVFSGAKGSEAEVAWRWVRAVESCAKAYGGDPDAIPTSPEAFESVVREALTPAEYRASFLTPTFKAEAKELYHVQQKLVREDLARIWGVGAVP